MQRLATISVIVTTLVGCAPAIRRPDPMPDRSTPVVEVHNDSAVEAVIYLVRGPLSFRLGTVAAQTRALLHVPKAISRASGHAFEARAFVVDEFYGPLEIAVVAGDRGVLRLLNLPAPQ